MKVPGEIADNFMQVLMGNAKGNLSKCLGLHSSYLCQNSNILQENYVVTSVQSIMVTTIVLDALSYKF